MRKRSTCRSEWDGILVKAALEVFGIVDTAGLNKVLINLYPGYIVGVCR
jgi:hypothetical protein